MAANPGVVAHYARVAVLAAMLVGCGGGSANFVSGSYRGVSYDAEDAITTTFREGGAYTVIVFKTDNNLCDYLSSGVRDRARLLTLFLLPPATSTGRFNVLDVPGAGIAFPILATETACGLAQDSGSARDGHVDVTRIEMEGDRPARLAGTFDLVMDSGDRLSGQFDVADCSTADLRFAVCP